MKNFGLLSKKFGNVHQMRCSIKSYLLQEVCRNVIACHRLLFKIMYFDQMMTSLLVNFMPLTWYKITFGDLGRDKRNNCENRVGVHLGKSQTFTRCRYRRLTLCCECMSNRGVISHSPHSIAVLYSRNNLAVCSGKVMLPPIRIGVFPNVYYNLTVKSIIDGMINLCMILRFLLLPNTNVKLQKYVLHSKIKNLG